MTGIPGLTKKCPRCDDPQNSVLDLEDWYLPADARTITDPDDLAKADAGPAWNCGHCNELNDGNVEVCGHCSRPRDFDDIVNREVTYSDHTDKYDELPDPLIERVESDAEKAQRTLDTAASGPRAMGTLTLPGKALPRTGKDTELYEGIRRQVHQDAAARERAASQPPIVQWASRHLTVLAIGAAAMVALIVVGAIVGIVHTVRDYTATTAGTVTVAELHWERGVEVEELKTLNESGWSAPSDARILGTENRIQSHRVVHDGWRTESYTDTETRYRTETYMGTETHYRSVSYTYACTDTASNGNGTYRTVTKTCTGTRSEPYAVSKQMTRQVPYTVQVPKTRQIEITHQEPIFGTWFTYQVDRWETDRWVTASDATSDKMIWPEVTDLTRNNQAGDQVDEERIGDDRKSTYTIIYVDSKGASHSERSDHDDVWTKLDKGEVIPARYYERNGELQAVRWSDVK